MSFLAFNIGNKGVSATLPLRENGVLMNLFRSILINSFIMLASVSAAIDIIVESRQEGMNHRGYKETAGRWMDSNTPATTAKSGAPGLTPQGQIGSRKTTVTPPANGTKETVLSAARFTPPLEVAGEYHVYATWPQASNAAPVTYLIKHANGEERREVSQNGWGATTTANGNEWIELGKYSFSPGGEQYVELQVTGVTKGPDPANQAQAFADAVRFTDEELDNLKAPATPAPAASTRPPVTLPSTPAAPAAAAGRTIAWQDDLTAARATASTQGKKVIVYFYSPQSARSTDYETQVLNTAPVQSLIAASYVPVKINMDTQRELAARLQVFRAGTIDVYDATSGSRLEQISDTPPADELLKRLNAVK